MYFFTDLKTSAKYQFLQKNIANTEDKAARYVAHMGELFAIFSRLIACAKLQGLLRNFRPPTVYFF